MFLHLSVILFTGRGGSTFGSEGEVRGVCLWSGGVLSASGYRGSACEHMTPGHTQPLDTKLPWTHTTIPNTTPNTTLPLDIQPPTPIEMAIEAGGTQTTGMHSFWLMRPLFRVYILCSCFDLLLYRPTIEVCYSTSAKNPTRDRLFQTEDTPF